MCMCIAGGNAATGKFIGIFTQLNEYTRGPVPSMPSDILHIVDTPEIHLIINSKFERNEQRNENENEMKCELKQASKEMEENVYGGLKLSEWCTFDLVKAKRFS